MIRFIWATVLSFVLVGLHITSDGFGDSNSPFQTWMSAFILPIWSLSIISLWHDFGRSLMKDIEVTDLFKSILFVLWMSLVMTYVVWTHISLLVIPMLFVIPLLGFPLRHFMIQDWTQVPNFKISHAITLLVWVLISYYVYWILTFAWVMLRVWMVEEFENGVVYFIR